LEAGQRWGLGSELLLEEWLASLPGTLVFTGLVLALASRHLHAGVGSAILYSAGRVAALSGLVAGVYVVYALVEGRNRHFSRSLDYWVSVIDRLERAGVGGGELGEARGAVEVGVYPGRMSPAVHVVLSVLTVVGVFYTLYRLNADYLVHEAAERRIFEAVRGALEGRGIRLGASWEPSVARRPVALYAALTVATLGLYAAYWPRLIVRDHNRHVATQLRLEEALEGVLSNLQRGRFQLSPQDS
jgi:hypothetical protein